MSTFKPLGKDRAVPTTTLNVGKRNVGKAPPPPPPIIIESSSEDEDEDYRPRRGYRRPAQTSRATDSRALAGGDQNDSGDEEGDDGTTNEETSEVEVEQDVTSSELRFGLLTHKGKIWTFKVVLHVYQNLHFSCCKDYYGKYYLERRGEKDLNVGWCRGTIVDKEIRDAEGNELWIKELLQPKHCKREVLMRHAHERHAVSELESYMQMFFEKNGSIRKDPRLTALRRQRLLGRKLLAVSEFQLNEDFRGTGLAQKALRPFLLSIAEESHGNAFAGHMFLSPATFAEIYDEYIEKEVAAGRLPKSRVRIEDKLISKYELSGLEVVFLGNRDWNGDGLTIMARSFTAAQLRAELQGIERAEEAANAPRLNREPTLSKKKRGLSQVGNYEERDDQPRPKKMHRGARLSAATASFHSRRSLLQSATAAQSRDTSGGVPEMITASGSQDQPRIPEDQLRSILGAMSVGNSDQAYTHPKTANATSDPSQSFESVQTEEEWRRFIDGLATPMHEDARDMLIFQSTTNQWPHLQPSNPLHTSVPRGDAASEISMLPQTTNGLGDVRSRTLEAPASMPRAFTSQNHVRGNRMPQSANTARC